MAQHPFDDCLTTAAQWSGLDNNPLRVRGWIGIGKAADLSLLGVVQPAKTFLGAWRSTRGRSLFGINEVWRNRLPTKRKTNCLRSSRSVVRFHQGALQRPLSEQGHLLLPRAHRQAVADLEPGPDALDSRKQQDRFGLVISLGQALINNLVLSISAQLFLNRAS